MVVRRQKGPKRAGGKSRVCPNFIPSRVSGRGYKIGPVCQFVRLSVCQRSHNAMTSWRHTHPAEGLWGKNTDKDTSREGASTLRRFHCSLLFTGMCTLILYFTVTTCHPNMLRNSKFGLIRFYLLTPGFYLLTPGCRTMGLFMRYQSSNILLGFCLCSPCRKEHLGDILPWGSENTSGLTLSWTNENRIPLFVCCNRFSMQLHNIDLLIPHNFLFLIRMEFIASDNLAIILTCNRILLLIKTNFLRFLLRMESHHEWLKIYESVGNITLRLWENHIKM